MITGTNLDQVDEFLQFVALCVLPVLGLLRLLQASLGQHPAVEYSGVVLLDDFEVSEGVSNEGSV